MKTAARLLLPIALTGLAALPVQATDIVTYDFDAGTNGWTTGDPDGGNGVSGTATWTRAARSCAPIWR